MGHADYSRRRWLVSGLVGTILLVWISTIAAAQPPIDFDRARQLLQKTQRGETLSQEEQGYLQRARDARRQMTAGQGRDPANRPAPLEPKSSYGLTPLCDMTAEDRYQGEDGGLYGRGANEPPESHRQAAAAALAKIQPLNRDGQPAADGRIVLVSISMSNATQEFSRFKQVADADAAKSDKLTIVDCAQGGQAMAEWVSPDARPWEVAMQRLTAAGVSPEQVQVAWVKLANKGPRGDLQQHGQILKQDTAAVLQNAKAKFPNLQIAYLDGRIYGGYTRGPLNPEPYAFESAFVVRWLIQDQIRGDKALNYDAAQGEAKSPLLLWGPYLWADGMQGRQADDLVWTREDLAGDGTHPSESGRDKVAKLLLDFFKTNPLAKPWFTGS